MEHAIFFLRDMTSIARVFRGGAMNPKGCMGAEHAQLHLGSHLPTLTSPSTKEGRSWEFPKEYLSICRYCIYSRGYPAFFWSFIFLPIIQAKIRYLIYRKLELLKVHIRFQIKHLLTVSVLVLEYIGTCHSLYIYIYSLTRTESDRRHNSASSLLEPRASRSDNQTWPGPRLQHISSTVYGRLLDQTAVCFLASRFLVKLTLAITTFCVAWRGTEGSIHCRILSANINIGA